MLIFGIVLLVRFLDFAMIRYFAFLIVGSFSIFHGVVAWMERFAWAKELDSLHFGWIAKLVVIIIMSS